jgi:glycerate kinase
LLQDASDRGVKRFIIGIGGSATNDGGAGMAQALGYHLLDERGIELPPGGLALARLHRIHLGGVHSDWHACDVQVASDVTNPLTGPSGASATYGPQKGASPAMVDQLDSALRRLAEVIRRDLQVEVESLPGAGAAGGLGAGLVAFTGARLRPGAEMVLEALRLDERLEGADLVVTGEGRIDSQTSRFGKGPAAVARHAHAAGAPALAVGGQVEEDPELSQLFDWLEAATPPGMPLEEALARARGLLVAATSRGARRFLESRS